MVQSLQSTYVIIIMYPICLGLVLLVQDSIQAHRTIGQGEVWLAHNTISPNKVQLFALICTLNLSDLPGVSFVIEPILQC